METSRPQTPALQQLIDSWKQQVQGNDFDPQGVLDRAKELAEDNAGLCQQG